MRASHLHLAEGEGRARAQAGRAVPPPLEGPTCFKTLVALYITEVILCWWKKHVVIDTNKCS